MSSVLTPMTTPVVLTERINRIEPSSTMAAAAEAEKLRQQGVDVVDVTAGEPHFTTPQHVKDAAIAAINANFSKYTAVGGTLELKDAIITRHATDFGSAYKREEVCASVGGKHALFNVISVLVDHGDEVILPVPYWVSFKDMVRYVGGKCVLLEADESQGFRVTAQHDRAPDHAQNQAHHPEFAVESVGRGDESRRHDRSRPPRPRARDLGYFRRVLRVSELHGQELLRRIAQ